MSTAFAKAFYWPSISMIALLAGGITGFQVASKFKPENRDFIPAGNGYEGDPEAAMKKFAEVKGSDYSKTLEPYEAIHVAFSQFAQEERTWTQTVGSSNAAGLVDQGIQATTVHDGNRYFEESNSFSSMVSIYDRMYQEGDSTTLYWGKTKEYAKHTPVTWTNEEYREKMGRNVSEALVYNVSEATLIAGGKSGERANGVYAEGGGYVVEAELSPVYGTLRYKCQMQTISDLASKPTFDYCHLTVYADKDLNLVKMTIHEQYNAAIKMGGTAIGSVATSVINISYYHEAPPFGFPEIGDPVPYPDK